MIAGSFVMVAEMVAMVFMPASYIPAIVVGSIALIWQHRHSSNNA